MGNDKETYSVGHAEAAIFRRLKDALTKGEITPSTFPNDYLELHRIVDPNSQAGTDFQRAMDKVLKTLVPEPEFSEVVSRHPISFLLSDTKEANGYIIPTENQTIICLDKELFKQCENFNQFAYILLHELTHLKTYDVFGEGKNSQTEEMACDVRPLRKMSELGLDMNEAKRIMEKFGEEKPPAWMALVDAHPLPHYRVDIIETALGWMRGLQGTEAAAESKAVMDMPVDLLKAAEVGKHHSFIDQQRTKSNFDSLTPDAQIDKIIEWVPAFEPRYFNRVTDAKELIEKINADPKNPQHTQKLTQIIEALLNNPPAFNALHEMLDAKLYGDGEKGYPGGRIEKLALEMQDFIDARSRGDIKEHAKRIMEIYNAQPSKHINWKRLELPYFELESKKQYKQMIEDAKDVGGDVHLPWHHQIEMLRHNYDSNTIRALWLCGVFDPRLLEIANAEDCLWFQTEASKAGFQGSYNMLSTPKSEKGSIGPHHLAIDQSGSLRNLISNDHTNVIQFYDDYYIKIGEKAKKLAREKVVDEAQLVSKNTELTLEGITQHEFVQKTDELLHANYNALILGDGLISVQEIDTFAKGEAEKREKTNEYERALRSETTKRMGNISTFVTKIDGWLSQKDSADYAACVAAVRTFFLEKKFAVNYQHAVTEHLRHESVLNRKTGGLKRPTFLINHSYFQFIAEDKHSLFSPQEKAQLLNEPQNIPPGISYWRKAFNYKEPSHFEELKSVLQRYSTACEYNTGDEINPITRYNHYLMGQGFTQNTTLAAITELALFIRNHKDESFPYVELMASFPALMTAAYRATEQELFIPDTGKAYSPKMPLQKYIKEGFRLPENPIDDANIYLCLADANIFPNEKWRAELVREMGQRMANITDIDQRIQSAEKLLLKNRDISDADIRQQTIKIWVEACKEKYGKDDGSKNYLDRIQPMIERVGTGSVFNIRHEMLRQFCDAVISQRDMSHVCEKTSYGNIDRGSLTDVGSLLGVSQVSIDVLTKGPKNREEMILFLIKPLTEELLNKFADPRIEDLLNITAKDPTPEEKRLVRTECRRIHENFWSAPLPARSFIMKALLFPAHERSSDKEKDEEVFQHAASFAMEELLPLKTPSGQPMPYAKESREFLKAFLAKNVLDENQRPLFVSALMSAVQHTMQQGTDVRIGQRLATLLEMMGPAWKKLGQAISSHPDTPRDIAQDMEPLKGKVDIPRWQMWSLFESTVPKKLRDDHPTLGPVLGSASFFTTVDAGDTVFAMQAPYARERAADGFATMERFIEELKIGKYAIGAAVPESVADMVRSARTSAALETNAKVGAAQAKALAQRYNGSSVEVNGKSYFFEAAQWFNYGPEFRHMKKMPGMVFNDATKAATGDIAKQEAIHDAAKAVAALEIKHHLDGGIADYDRHGRNFVIDGKKIGMFDVGATHALIRDSQGKTIEPNDADKVDAALNDGGSVEVYQPGDKRYADKKEMPLLGNALAESLKALQKDKPLAVVMHEQIEQARREGKNPEHLIRVERGLLALQDCLKHLNNEGKDITDIFAGIYNGGGKNSFVHEDIRKVLEQRVASGEFGQATGKAKTALKAAGLLGMNKGQLMLNSHFDDNAPKPVIIKPGKSTTLSEPKFWDIPKNKQEIPSLCQETDIIVKTPPKPKAPKETTTSLSSRRLHVPMESYVAGTRAKNTPIQLG